MLFPSCHWFWERNAAPLSASPPWAAAEHWGCLLASSKLDSSVDIYLSSQDMPSSLFTSFVAFQWMFSNILIFLDCVPRTAHRRDEVTQTLNIAGVTSFDCLAILCLMLPRMQFAARAPCDSCWAAVASANPLLLSCFTDTLDTCLPVGICVWHCTVPGAVPSIIFVELHATIDCPSRSLCSCPSRSLYSLQSWQHLPA